MSTTKKEALKNEVWDLSKIILKAQESFRVAEFLAKGSEDEHEAYIKRMNMFFRHTMITNWQVTATELSKLFSKRDSDQYNLKKFFNRLRKGGDFHSPAISESQIIDWEKALDKEKTAIENLIIQRDKLYAHSDRNSSTIFNEVSLSKTKELIDVAQSIIREIYLAVFETSMIFDPVGSPIESLKYVIKSMAKQKEEKEDALKELALDHGIDDEFK